MLDDRSLARVRTGRHLRAWQARNLAAAHGVGLAWGYGLEAGTVWQGWQARDEAPVDTPLKSLAQALHGVGLVLCSFGVDDSVFAFAVAAPQAAGVQSLCGSLGVQLRLPT